MARATDPNDILPPGVIAAATTPIRERSNYVDLGAAMEIIDFLNASPAVGISILGSTGSFLHFDVEEREKFITFAAKRSKKPIIVGVSHSTFDVTLHLIEHAAASGAAAALVLPPYYFKYTPAQIEAYFTALGERASSHLPIYLYNIPFFTGTIPVEVSHRLLSSGHWTGIKDSSGQPEYLAALQDTGKTLLVGNDSAIQASRRQGAAGVISGCAACIPELICALDHAVVSGNEAKEAVLRELLGQFFTWLDRFPTPVGIELGCHIRKLPSRRHDIWLPTQVQEEFTAWFNDWLPIVLKESASA